MSVKVAVRVRPFNEREKQNGSNQCIEMNQTQTTIINPKGGDAINKEGQRTFTFDYSFWSFDGFEVSNEGVSVKDSPDSRYCDQSFVYDLLGKEVLDNAWQGYHCCLFAYGQTGSGKSYSMVGYGKNPGIVPMACDEIFSRIKANKDPANTYEVQFSMLEIYNEKVQDLLQKNENMKPSGGLKVRENRQGGIYVQDLTKHAVDSYELIAKKMDEGYTSRSIGATQMNQTSSRAHTIITIEFKQIRTEQGRKVEKFSCINLVDLAGSEKAGQTGAEGLRLKEGSAINKSLTVLGTCISVLAEKSQGKSKNAVVPYRDSNLTRILQNALGGNSKTIMICAISPAGINYEESLSTLRYADRAKQIINKAVVNEDVQDKIIRELKSENEQLKKQFQKIMIEAQKKGGIINLNELGFLDPSEILEEMKYADEQLNEREKTWDEKLQEQREKDEQDKQIQEKQKNLSNKKAPHLTNLNEDVQLTGKIYYSLANLHQEPVFIGRNNGKPVPQIILRGAGVQQNHAYFKVDSQGVISINIKGEEAHQSTLVNGQKLLASRSNFRSNFSKQSSTSLEQSFGQQEEQLSYSQELNHLDRICIGHGMLFLFRYPLQHFRKQQFQEQICETDPNIEPEQLDEQVEQQLSIEGITDNPQILECEQYSEQQIQDDELTTLECFESAYEESRREENNQLQQNIFQQEKLIEQEKERIQNEYTGLLEQLKRQEEEKIQELINQNQSMQQTIQKSQQLESGINSLQEQIEKKNEELRIAQEEAKNKINISEMEEIKRQLKKEQEEKQQILDNEKKLQQVLEEQKVELQKKFQEEKDKKLQQVLEEQKIELQKKFLEEKIQLEKKIKDSRRSSMLFNQYQNEYQLIKEANEICKTMKRNIQFVPILMKVQEDLNERNMTFTNKSSANKNELKEELQVKVVNKDKNNAIQILSFSQFEDKLEMMKEALANYDLSQSTKNSIKESIFSDDLQSFDIDSSFDIKSEAEKQTQQIAKMMQNIENMKTKISTQDRQKSVQIENENNPKNLKDLQQKQDQFMIDLAYSMQNENTIDLDNIDGLEAFSGKKIQKEEQKVCENFTPQQSELILIDEIFDNFDSDQKDFQNIRKFTDLNHNEKKMEKNFLSDLYKEQEIFRARQTGMPTKKQKKDDTETNQRIQVKQVFLENLLSQYTPVQVQSDLYMKPIPKVIGNLQCTVYRNNSGLNKFSPKYYLKLKDTNQQMLMAEKLTTSVTKHFQIKIDTEYLKYTKNDKEMFLGRLRCNLACNQFFIFDFGSNPRDLKPGQKLKIDEKLRNQYGTILYLNQDRSGKKVTRNIEMFIPEQSEDDNQALSWPDTERKKQHIYNEYEEFKASNGKISLETDPQYKTILENTDAQSRKQHTQGIQYYQSVENPNYLNFGAGVKPSVKNAQLVKDNDPKKVLLQFGRLNDNQFDLDIHYPFSIFQAFAFCLSTFEYKI